MTVNVHYLDTEADLAWRQGNTQGALEMSQSIRLLDRLRRADWRFYEPRQRIWFETWPEGRTVKGAPRPRNNVTSALFLPARENVNAPNMINRIAE